MLKDKADRANHPRSKPEKRKVTAPIATAERSSEKPAKPAWSKGGREFEIKNISKNDPKVPNPKRNDWQK